MLHNPTVEIHNDINEAALMSLLLALNIFHTYFLMFLIAIFEHVFVCWFIQ